MDRADYRRCLDYLSRPLAPKKAFVGLDGFVDDILAVVDERTDGEHYSRIDTMEAYARRILEGSGLSLNLEVVPLASKIGGNGPIYANGLKRLGVDLVYMGAVGVERVHPVFTDLAQGDGANVIGIAEPAHTDAYEFRDGKIITSRLPSLNALTWRDITAKLPEAELARQLDRADIFSMNNWTMIPAMNEIWARFLHDIVPRMTTDRRSKIAFFDLADPRKRSDTDIACALERIRSFAGCGFRTMLGLNLKEAKKMEQLIHTSALGEDMERVARNVATYMQIDCLTVHRADLAACVQDGAYVEVAGPYCERPMLKTGAGDVFNSGFVFGQSQGWPPKICLMVGALTSGYYVRKAQSATMEGLTAFCSALADGQSPDR